MVKPGQIDSNQAAHIIVCPATGVLCCAASFTHCYECGLKEGYDDGYTDCQEGFEADAENARLDEDA